MTRSVYIGILCAALAVFAGIHAGYCEAPTGSGGGTYGLGFPVGGGDDEARIELCPQGARVITMFLTAWQNRDYQSMYELLDDEGKEDYTYDQARFDFQFMEFKQYEISVVKRSGDDFEFVLSYGDWKDGDKEVKKVIIDGESYKIKMPSSGTIFKESAESYF